MCLQNPELLPFKRYGRRGCRCHRREQTEDSGQNYIDHIPWNGSLYRSRYIHAFEDLIRADNSYHNGKDNQQNRAECRVENIDRAGQISLNFLVQKGHPGGSC